MHTVPSRCVKRSKATGESGKAPILSKRTHTTKQHKRKSSTKGKQMAVYHAMSVTCVLSVCHCCHYSHACRRLCMWRMGLRAVDAHSHTRISESPTQTPLHAHGTGCARCCTTWLAKTGTSSWWNECPRGELLLLPSGRVGQRQGRQGCGAGGLPRPNARGQ